jgi:16S rRNA (guanine527-N7)-methyltransferase
MSNPHATPDPIAIFQQALLAGAADLGIRITDQELDLFAHHYSLLLQRRTHGLTTITDPVHAAIKHFLDSLTPLLLRDIQPGERVADIGSGSGFPGIPLAIVRPHASYTLVESNQRRAAFLREAAAALGCSDVTVIADRAETLGRDPQHRERYDLVVARALAPLPVLLEYCLPLLRIGGDCLALKGPAGERDLAHSHRALTTLGGHLAATRNLSLPNGMGDRFLVMVRKVSPTPVRYPRRPGIAAKRPLL